MEAAPTNLRAALAGAGLVIIAIRTFVGRIEAVDARVGRLEATVSSIARDVSFLAGRQAERGRSSVPPPAVNPL